MKKALFALALLSLATVVWATTNPTEALINRIASDVQVCVTGADCSADGMAASRAASAAVDRSGADVYAAACAACHNSGAAGAPRIGVGNWQERVDARGQDLLVQHSIEGYNAMPPKGGCSGCSDTEVAAAVEYILGESL